MYIGKFNEAQFELDLQKAVRKINLHKIFKSKPVMMSNKWKSEMDTDRSASIGPLGFSLSLNFSIQEREALLRLCKLLNEDQILTTIEIHNKFSGGSKKKMFP